MSAPPSLIGTALDAAQAITSTHRDFKPNNALYNAEGQNVCTTLIS